MPTLKCSTVQCVGKKISLPRTHTLPRDLGKGPGSLVELERASVPRPLHRHTHTHTSQLSLTGQSDSRFTLDKTPFCCESCKDLHVFIFGLPIHFWTVTTITTNLPLIFNPTFLSILDVFHLILERYPRFTSIKDFIN